MSQRAIADAAENMRAKGVLSLEEKERFNEAEYGQKFHVLAQCLLERRFALGAALTAVFFKGLREASRGPKLPETQATGPGQSADTLHLCPPEEYRKLCKERSGEIYPIKEKGARIRLALIICNTAFDHLSPRYGAEHDIAEMTTLLDSLDYTVDVREQLTAQEMKSELQEFAARPEHRASDSTFVVLMSHGLLEGVCGIEHSEEKPDMLPYDTVFRIFNNRHCPHLKDKPKVIIIQACRGANRGEVKMADSASWTNSPAQLSHNLEEDAVTRAHIEKDFIAFYSSTPHNVSWRDAELGSPFIVQLTQCFRKYSWRLHLEEVFRKVQQSFDNVSTKIQMPTIERQSLTRYFYLFPGN